MGRTLTKKAALITNQPKILTKKAKNPTKRKSRRKLRNRIASGEVRNNGRIFIKA
jgi:hypothetical protein